MVGGRANLDWVVGIELPVGKPLGVRLATAGIDGGIEVHGEYIRRRIERLYAEMEMDLHIRAGGFKQ